MGLSALTAYRGDIVLAKAAEAANVPNIMSGSSLIRLEHVASVSASSWFQAYLPGDNAAIEALIARVATAGFGTLVITVDTPVAANVERDFSDRGHLNWKHFAQIRRQWSGTLVVKGIVNAADARTARDTGADGIIVSNHGGRQLDGTVSPLDVLPDVVHACPDIEIMLDSGVRRGTDVLKALALGARLVFVGRPFAYAAAFAGKSQRAIRTRPGSSFRPAANRRRAPFESRERRPLE